ncbi:MAG: carboxylesterase family protein [Bacteroidales bacterium]
MKSDTLIAVALITIFMSGHPDTVFGQRYQPGPQDMTFFSSVDESNQPYAIYIPYDFDESKEYPLVVFLHGAYSNHRLGLRRVFGEGNIQGPDFGTPGFEVPETDLEATRYYPELKHVDYIVAAPYARGTAGYQGIPEQDIFDMLADIKSKFSIDEDRMYLTGLSMGGGGTLWVGLTRPDLWAAIAPVCPAPPEDANNLAGNALNIPVHLFVGDRDGLMATADTWNDRFKSRGVDVEYMIYPGIAHNSWEYAYKDGFIFEWFSQFERNLFPNEVNFTTSTFKYDRAYWVKLDNLTPGVEASIEAKFTGTNTLEIATSDLLAFTLDLEGHPQFEAGSKVKLEIDGSSFSVKSPDAVSFTKMDGTWKNRKFTPGRFSKQRGAEGPLADAIRSNHIYVYGTLGDPSREELQDRSAIASHAADWAYDRGFSGRVMIFPRALADIGVRQSDLETSNLVLFGTTGTNSWIAKYADRLPMLLDEHAEGYGLVYIYPMNGHYVLINSGLPWWTPPASAEQGRGGISRLSGRGSSLDAFPDFILFKDTPDNVISEGYFTNNWEIPESERSKLEGSGAVEIK